MTLHHFLIGLGGFFGAISRHLICSNIARTIHPALPLGTLIVNITGSFFAGALLTYFTETSNAKVFLNFGFHGAFTTFSAFSFETLALFQKNLYAMAFINIASNLFFGFGAALLGRYLTQAFI